MEEEKTEMQKALELVEKDKVERQQRAWEKLSDFIIALEKEENVNIGIQPIQIQPQLTIIAK
jgi:hypothetical protein